MTVRKRILIIGLIEKAGKQPEFAKKLFIGAKALNLLTGYMSLNGIKKGIAYV